jgi:hypothetical protein
LNYHILQPEVQHFINAHLKDDAGKIALSKSPFPHVTPRELAEQIASKQRSEKKLPSWFRTPGILYPPKLSVEQCSSELTAQYKSELVQGGNLADLTGGFGVDAFYFAKKAKQVIHCEQHAELSKIAEHNAKVLETTNIEFVCADSMQYLRESEQHFETIFIDPSRRIQTKKVFLLRDTEPDVVSNLPLLLERSSRVIIKTSPLFDIQSGLNELSEVSEVHVISLKNDCKELLWVIDRGFSDEPVIIATALDARSRKSFQFRLSDERRLHLDSYVSPQAYLYEPDVALLKAGCFKTMAQRFDLSKLDANTHLYTSNELKSDFIGKVFVVNSVQNYKTFIKSNVIKKANIITRNFPLSPDELKKKHKLTDGGEQYLIFTTVAPNNLQVIAATVTDKASL